MLPCVQTASSDMKVIYDFLSQKVDVHSARLAPELIDQFVEVVTAIADYSYRWKLNTGCKKSKGKKSPPSRQNPSTFSPVLCSNSLLDCRVSSCAGLSGQQISVRSALFGASNSQQGLLSPQLLIPSHQSLASLLYFSAAPVEPFPNQKSEAGRIPLPIFSNLIYFQRTLCTRGRSRRHLPWKGDHTAHAWRAWRCRSLPLLRPSPPS